MILHGSNYNHTFKKMQAGQVSSKINPIPDYSRNRPESRIFENRYLRKAGQADCSEAEIPIYRGRDKTPYHESTKKRKHEKDNNKFRAFLIRLLRRQNLSCGVFSKLI